MKPLVSILIPAYNCEAWLADTVRSALEQTWPRKEIIIVDDGSKDDTLAVAQRFASPQVSVVTQENQGASAARNHAFARAQGDYIQWLDADDLLSPDKIARQIEAAQHSEKRTLLSSGWAYFRHRPTRARFEPTPLWCDLTPLEWMLRKWEGNHHMQTATWLVSRELTTAAGQWDSRLSFDDDGEYFFRVILASEAIRFIPVGAVYYRVSGTGGLSYLGASKAKLDSLWLSMSVQIDTLLSRRNDARARAACVNYLQSWLMHFHECRPDLVAKARERASEFGGNLTAPKLSWKYAWIEHLFGWSTAQRVQIHYNKYKTSLLNTLDRSVAYLERNRTIPGKHPFGTS